jgi:hypothetical protein
MTAMNAFARDGGAYLIADTAAYHHDGRIMGFYEKVVTDARLAMMIGICGRAAREVEDRIEAWLADQPDQTTAFARLSAFLCQLVDEAEEEDDGEAGDLPDGIRLTLAWWDADAQEGRCAIIASTPDLAGGAETFALRPVRTMFMPALEGADPWPGHSFDPETDALALAEHQRRCDHGDGRARVGGQMILYRVAADSITSRELRRWSDLIGRPIMVTT